MKKCPICDSTRVMFERVLNDTDLVRCQSCSFVYADLKDEEIEKANTSYDEQSIATYATNQTILDQAWFRRIARRLSRSLDVDRVLDVGCGNGQLLRLFKTYGWDCYGADPSPWSRRFSEAYGFELFQGVIEGMGLEKDFFDLIVSTSTLEHIAAPLAHVQKVVRLLKPGGTAYLCGVPNYGSASVILGVSQFHSNAPPEHVNYFTHRTLRRLFDELPEPPRDVRVRTYGIPEVFRLYNRITQCWKRARRNERITSRPESRLLIIPTLCYHYLGRPFLLGDKLEITAVK